MIIDAKDIKLTRAARSSVEAEYDRLMREAEDVALTWGAPHIPAVATLCSVNPDAVTRAVRTLRVAGYAVNRVGDGDANEFVFALDPCDAPPTLAGAAERSKPPEGSPDYDRWGILNWARYANRNLFDSVPAARRYMIRDAAVKRWQEHYQHRNTVAEFLAFADWLVDNLAEITAESDDWPTASGERRPQKPWTPSGTEPA